MLAYLRKRHTTELKNTLLYIIDNHSDIQEVTSVIENYEIQDVEIKKERHTKTLTPSECMLKGYTLLYPKCKYIMHIDIDTFDEAYIQQVTDSDHTYLTKLHEQYKTNTILCDRTYSYSFFNRDMLLRIVNILDTPITYISGDILYTKIEDAGIRLIESQ
jgi:hypothetical protein